MKLNKQNLLNCFSGAQDENARFIAVAVRMNHLEKDEIIINERENFNSKLEYYLQVYDDDLKLKNNSNIQIIGFTYGDSFDDVQADLID